MTASSLLSLVHTLQPTTVQPCCMGCSAHLLMLLQCSCSCASMLSQSSLQVANYMLVLDRCFFWNSATCLCCCRAIVAPYQCCFEYDGQAAAGPPHEGQQAQLDQLCPAGQVCHPARAHTSLTACTAQHAKVQASWYNSARSVTIQRQIHIVMVLLAFAIATW